VSPKNSAESWVVSLLFTGYLFVGAGIDLQASSISTQRDHTYRTYRVTIGAPSSRYIDRISYLKRFDIDLGTGLIFCLPGSDKFC
jgi:hypothetical protein